MPDGFSNNNPQKSQKRFRWSSSNLFYEPSNWVLQSGCCETDYNDYGLHTVCSEMTVEFLEYSKSVGKTCQHQDRV